MSEADRSLKAENNPVVDNIIKKVAIE